MSSSLLTSLCSLCLRVYVAVINYNGMFVPAPRQECVFVALHVVCSCVYAYLPLVNLRVYIYVYIYTPHPLVLHQQQFACRCFLCPFHLFFASLFHSL